MGILSRFGDIMRSNVNALLDKAEDPAKMVDQLLLDMREQLASVRSETAGVVAAEKQAKRLLDECQAKVDKYERAAMNALSAGNDADARTLVERKQALEAELAGHRKNYDAASANADKMRKMHDHLVQQIAECESRKAMVKAQVATARAQQSVNRAMGSMSSSASQSAFARMEARASEILDRAEAEAELSAGTGDDAASLADRYAGGAAGSVDDELARMRARLAGGAGDDA